MKKIIQAIPNISEGRDRDKIEKILDSVRNVEGSKLINYSWDENHNRSVITLVGEPEGIYQAMVNLIDAAMLYIDMRKHEGKHPRMGAVDVLPLVPIKNVSMEECVELAKRLGKYVGDKKIPVYFYEYAQDRDYRKNLADVRRGQYEGFFDKINDPLWKPDLGPSIMNEKFGAIAIAARKPLIAYNINLNTEDLSIARQIAKKIRFRDGGLEAVKALGIFDENKGLVQVSMNLVDYKLSSMAKVFERVKELAEERGVQILSSELIGALPSEALIDVAKYYLKIEDFKNEQVLEYGILE